MICRRHFRPLLRVYYRNPKLFGATLLLAVILTIFYTNAITTPLSALINVFVSSNSDNEEHGNDIFIPHHEFHFEMKEGDSQSLFGNAQCLLLDLDYKSAAIMKFQKNLGSLKCSGDKISHLGPGVLHVKGTGLQDVSYQAIQVAKSDEDGGFRLGDRMSVVTAQVQLTPEHSDSIAHFLGKCVHPLGASMRPGVQLVLWDSCGEDRIEFLLEEDGTLKHKASGFCVGPKAEIAEVNKAVVLTDRCDDSTKFRGLENGFLQHLSSELCVHYQSTDIDPPNDVPLVFFDDCEKNWKMRFGWARDFSKSRKKETDVTTEISDEFIQVNIQFASGLPSHATTEYHIQVFPKFNLKKPKDIEQKPNMLILMLHSTSYSHFMRKLPKTYAFLQKLSGTVFFKGFSVFDDSSKAQLIAAMSGVEPDKLSSYNSFNELPWLHTLHKEQGYVTMLAEDKPCSPQYTDSLCDFQGSPTDHYGLPFWTAVHKTYSPGHNTFCMGRTAIHNISLGYLRDFMAIYTRLPKYAAIMLSELSSWNFNALSYQDEDIARFLAWMKIKGHLDHTVITIFSNHGSKNEMLRRTLQGKLEERNPFLSITIPPKAPKALLDALPTMRKNARGLVTPYDLYATLRQIVPAIPLRHGGAGENLLEPFKDESKRTCEDLNIPNQWCPCLSVYEYNSEDKQLEKIAMKVVEYVNEIISADKEMTDLCLKLEFASIKKAAKLTPTDEVLKFKFSKHAGKCTNCPPVYGPKMKDSFYILYIDVKEGITLRAIINMGKKSTIIHPNVVGTGLKESDCWRTRKDVKDVWKLCACK